MEFKEIKKDNELLIKELSSLASFIIREHYDPILGERQNTYMIIKISMICFPRNIMYRQMVLWL